MEDLVVAAPAGSVLQDHQARRVLTVSTERTVTPVVPGSPDQMLLATPNQLLKIFASTAQQAHPARPAVPGQREPPENRAVLEQAEETHFLGHLVLQDPQDLQEMMELLAIPVLQESQDRSSMFPVLPDQPDRPDSPAHPVPQDSLALLAAHSPARKDLQAILDRTVLLEVLVLQVFPGILDRRVLLEAVTIVHRRGPLRDIEGSNRSLIFPLSFSAHVLV